MINLNDPLIGLPPGLNPAITQTKNYFAALENFQRTFAFKQGDSVLLLTDPLLDVRVTDVIIGLAKARGATVRQFMETSSQITAVPEATKALVAEADFVVSTWFCSILDPFFIAQRALVQRWVKITCSRDLDLLYSPQARFPAELVGEIIRATAARLPAGKDFSIQFADARGTDFSINSRLTCVRLCWVATAGAARCLLTSPAATYTTCPPTAPTCGIARHTVTMPMHPSPCRARCTPNGRWVFVKLFTERICCRFESDTIAEVTGQSGDAAILRDILVGGRLIELGCGFNPKAPRHTIYPAGSNTPGALHFGIDLAQPSDYILRTMPQWEEPPAHMDLVCLDSTVTVDGASLIEAGFLSALRHVASKFGNSVELLETAI